MLIVTVTAREPRESVFYEFNDGIRDNLHFTFLPDFE